MNKCVQGVWQDVSALGQAKERFVMTTDEKEVTNDLRRKDEVCMLKVSFE